MGTMESFQSIVGFLCLALSVFSLAPYCHGEKCNQEVNCQLPDCFCATYDHPLGRDYIPQIVYFGFDDAVTPQVSAYYDQLFTKERKNPNGCPITMTLFISDQYTQYNMVSDYYRKGDEAGVHSVTHTDIDTAAKLLKEATEQKMNIEQKANVPAKDVVGWRSPNLKTAGDDQPRILQQLNYTYDISLSYDRDKNYPFPFTLDFGYPYPCTIQPCPGADSRHMGFWEVMIHGFTDPATGLPCGYVDGCRPEGKDAAVEYLWSNFLTTYEKNKAPFGLNMHAAWFAFPGYIEAMGEFIDRILQKPDVYIVTVEQMIKWMKTPFALSDIKYFEPWGCKESSGNKRPSRAVSNVRSPVPKSPPRQVVTDENNDNDDDSISGHSVLSSKNTHTVTSESHAQRESRGHAISNLPSWFHNYAGGIKSSFGHGNVNPITTTTRSSPSSTPFPTHIPYVWQRFISSNANSERVRSGGSDSCSQGENCMLPHCFCKTKSPPTGRARRSTPQIVYLAFDCHIDGRTYGPLTQIFAPYRINPNGCPVSGSVFIPLRGNYPPYAQALAKMGARLGVVVKNDSSTEHGINPLVLEITEVQESFKASYGVHSIDLNARYSNRVANALHSIDDTINGFIVRNDPDASWPYTLDFGVGEKQCIVSSDCPQDKYPGLWEVSLSPLQIPGSARACWYPEHCPSEKNVFETYHMLKHNFDRHYFNDRIPLGIRINEEWLVNGNVRERIRGLNLFLDYVLQKPDAMVMSVDKMLQWVASSDQYGHYSSC